ncbi:TerY-C metal binding domain-containing protein [Niveispirillum sp. BGYR6]|uniref:TerY-C metal binding domain-containing protein n=1 Tax=Niveispirillum sp. BGYR6 TaxID=2971249 RepID=UPI0022B995EC|nr:TerY-C metal binding domain-containing protein [Niveispirillum sp. BGYR6]MDG5496020.1 TerY-C metal binding domain-containing protein [Niveispirillum sp. BGYR6]
MRRLPIFFLVDVSESMVGEKLYKLEEGIGAVVSTLRKDPYALEMAFLSVIAFAGKAKTVTQFTELFAFHPPELPVGGGTALGAALSHLMDEIDRTVVTTTPDRKGDWRPIIFLLTDGYPTDNVTPALERWNRSYRHRVGLVAISIGGGADHTLLKRLTDDVVVFNDSAQDAFARFIRWISMSIQSQSRSVSAGQDGKVNLAKAEPGLLVPVESAAGLAPFAGVDDRYAVFVGKCAKKKLPYVVKYERHMGRMEASDPVLANLLKTRRYALDTAVPVKHSYFDLSDTVGSGQSVYSEDLIGQPNCPHCGARFAMAVCGCGKIHCVEGEGEQTCPWCDKIGIYGTAEAGDGFDIGRGRG